MSGRGWESADYVGGDWTGVFAIVGILVAIAIGVKVAEAIEDRKRERRRRK